VSLVQEELRATVSSGQHAIAIGVFDGVHRGHQMLLQKMLSEASQRDITGGVITFYPHPIAVIKPEIKISYLESLERRIELLSTLGVDFVSVLQFTAELQQVTAKEFAELLVREAGLKVLVVGENFRVGRGGEGNVDYLSSLGSSMGFEVIPVPLFEDNSGYFSSTRIREALHEGKMEVVNDLLGRPFALRGPVLHGDHRGRELGFPTLNIETSADRQLPPDGVYITRALIGDRKIFSCTNIGLRPTFGSSKTRLIETHLLDFDDNLYGEIVTIELLSYLRPEMKFNGVEELIQQIESDLTKTRAWFV